MFGSKCGSPSCSIAWPAPARAMTSTSSQWTVSSWTFEPSWRLVECTCCLRCLASSFETQTILWSISALISAVKTSLASAEMNSSYSCTVYESLLPKSFTLSLFHSLLVLPRWLSFYFRLLSFSFASSL